jgi:hypothetical protein
MEGGDGRLGEESGEVSTSVEDRVAKLVESCRALQEAASSHSSQWQHETDALSKQAVTHLATMKKLQGDLYAACEKDEINHHTAEKVWFLPFLSPTHTPPPKLTRISCDSNLRPSDLTLGMIVVMVVVEAHVCRRRMRCGGRNNLCRAADLGFSNK